MGLVGWGAKLAWQAKRGYLDDIFEEDPCQEPEAREAGSREGVFSRRRVLRQARWALQAPPA
ncbi:hypothetical protein CE91St32_24190 [Gordonibacter pamelaeae]|nr:hypothetical protein CE91St32_24190 [Gordonibacter pamelaeae]